MNKVGLSILLILLSTRLEAQFPLFAGQVFFCADSSHCETGVQGMLPSRWIQVSYEKSSPFQADQGLVGISQFRRASAKARIPLLNKPGLKIVGGFSYQQEYIGLSGNASTESFPWQEIDQLRFNNRGMDLVWLHPFRGKAYLAGRVSMNIANEERGFRWRQYSEDIRFTVSQMMVFRPHPGQEFGVGAYVARSQGRTSSYPVIVYNQTFNRNWGIESLLPAYVRVRRNLGSTAALLLNVKASGGSFNFDMETDNGIRDLSLRRAEVIGGLSYQQEIADPLWIGFDLGIRQPLSMNLFDPTAPRTPVASSNLRATTYFNTSLYLVPPSKLIKKMISKSKAKGL